MRLRTGSTKKDRVSGERGGDSREKILKEKVGVWKERLDGKEDEGSKIKSGFPPNTLKGVLEIKGHW